MRSVGYDSGKVAFGERLGKDGRTGGYLRHFLIHDAQHAALRLENCIRTKASRSAPVLVHSGRPPSTDSRCTTEKEVTIHSPSEHG